MSKDKKEMKTAAKESVKTEQAQVKAKMRFTEDKYYSDPNVVHFEKGKVYEVCGQDMINRWLKRGGEIVTEEMLKQEAKPKTVETKVETKVEVKKPDEASDKKEPVVTSSKKDEDNSKPLSTKQKVGSF